MPWIRSLLSLNKYVWQRSVTCSYLCPCHRHLPAITSQWCHNERVGVSNHKRLDCLLNHLFRCRWKKTSKLCVTGLCEGNSQFPAQRAGNTENVSIWWRHYERHMLSSPQANPHRREWARERCRIISESAMFEDCRKKVTDYDTYYRDCLYDACA